jgi:predicted solute-binding protein
LTNEVGKEIRVGMDIRSSNEYYAEVVYELKLERPTTFHFVFRDCKKAIVKEFLRRVAMLRLSLDMKTGGY